MHRASTSTGSSISKEGWRTTVDLFKVSLEHVYSCKMSRENTSENWNI